MDAGSETVRLDRWLWSVRVYKTRSLAAAACTGGHVQVGERSAKPAYKLKVGDRVTALVGDRVRILEVVRLIEKRVGAPVATTCFVDQSPVVVREPRVAQAVRDRGAGRPTKRDRRQLDRHFGRRD